MRSLIVQTDIFKDLYGLVFIYVWAATRLLKMLFFGSPSGMVISRSTAYMRQLNLPPIIWNVSHLKIFPLQLLGPAIGLSAGPSSCKGKILRWDTTTNSPTTNKCLILDVSRSYPSHFFKFCEKKEHFVYVFNFF